MATWCTCMQIRTKPKMRQNRKITSGKEKKNGTYFEKKMVAKVEFLRRRDRRYLHGNAYVVKAPDICIRCNSLSDDCALKSILTIFFLHFHKWKYLCTWYSFHNDILIQLLDNLVTMSPSFIYFCKQKHTLNINTYILVLSSKKDKE